MTGTIKVTPEKLRTTAVEFGNQGSTVNTLTSQMMSLVTGLSSAWEGEASATYLAKFRGLENDIQKINRMIQEHVNDLEEMATLYQAAETANVESAQALASDVIS